MSIEEAIMEKVKILPEAKQQEVLDFVLFLYQRSEKSLPRRSIKGLWSDLNEPITAEDITEARKEIWGNFPRDIEV